MTPAGARHAGKPRFVAGCRLRVAAYAVALLCLAGCQYDGGITPGPSDDPGNGNNTEPPATRVVTEPSLEAPLSTAPQPGADFTVAALQALLDSPPSECSTIDAALRRFVGFVQASPNDAAAQTGLLYLQLIAAAYNVRAALGEAWLPVAPSPFDVPANLVLPPAMAGLAGMEMAPALPPPLATWHSLWPETPARRAGLNAAQAAFAAEAMPLYGGRDGATGALERLAALAGAEGTVLRVRVPLGGERVEVSFGKEDFALMRAGVQAARAVLLAASSRALDSAGYVTDRAWVDRDADQNGLLEHGEYVPPHPFAGLLLSGQDGPNGTIALTEARAAVSDVAACLPTIGRGAVGSLVAACGDLESLATAWALRGDLVAGEVEASLALMAEGTSDSRIEERRITVDASALFLNPTINPASLVPTLSLSIVDGAPTQIAVSELHDPTLCGLLRGGLPMEALAAGIGAVRVAYGEGESEIVLLDAPVRWTDDADAARSTLTGTVTLDVTGPALVFARARPEGGNYASLSGIDVVFSDDLGGAAGKVTRSEFSLAFHGSAGSVRAGRLSFYGPTGALLYRSDTVNVRLGEDLPWPSDEIRVPVDLGSGGLNMIVQ